MDVWVIDRVVITDEAAAYQWESLAAVENPLVACSIGSTGFHTDPIPLCWEFL